MAARLYKPLALNSLKCGLSTAWGAGCETLSIDDQQGTDYAIVAIPIAGFVQPSLFIDAIRLALARPMMVKRLVLVVTSGGVPVADLGGSDWRADYFAAYPGAASWIAHPTEDLSDRIPSIDAAALLIWGDNDPISPIAVGERLSALFPNAQLCVIPGADHDLAQTHAEIVANMIERHLSAAM